MKEWISSSPEETHAVAAEIARTLKPGSFILLHGDLGAGKTELVKGLAHELGYEGDVSSPTFNLVHEYPGTLSLHHWDLYRLDERTDWSVLDLQEHLAGRDITVVEWPERNPSWPRGAIQITLTILPDGNRRITCES